MVDASIEGWKGSPGKDPTDAPIPWPAKDMRLNLASKSSTLWSRLDCKVPGLRPAVGATNCIAIPMEISFRSCTIVICARVSHRMAKEVSSKKSTSPGTILARSPARVVLRNWMGRLDSCCAFRTAASIAFFRLCTDTC